MGLSVEVPFPFTSNSSHLRRARPFPFLSQVQDQASLPYLASLHLQYIFVMDFLNSWLVSTGKMNPP